MEYTVLEFYDAGRNTKIYRVLRDGCILCMKKLERSPNSERYEKRMENEVEIYRKLPEHSNIVKFIDYQSTPNELCLFMTLYDTSAFGLSFGHKMGDCINILLSLARGLEHLHRYNIIHRDVKPDNIFLFMNGEENVIEARLGDFDNASNINEVNCASLVGTMGYIAPEVLRREAYSFKADIWSFGMTIYSLITGNMPFYNLKNDVDIAEVVIDGVTPVLEIRNIRFNALDKLYQDCVEYKPGMRPNITQVVQRLEAF